MATRRSKEVLKRTGKTLAALLMAVGFCLPVSAEEIQDENLLESTETLAGQDVYVSAGAEEIKISIPAFGSGEASIYVCNADEYFSGDTMTGLSENKGSVGTAAAAVTLGTAQEITLPRYADDGSDQIYKKFYIVQNGSIIKGPYYAADITAKRNIPSFAMNTKKGLTYEDRNTVSAAVEIGASNTVVNMDLGQMILANEDTSGNPIDHSGEANVIPFESNGRTYYFDAPYVASRDERITSFSREGMNVSLVIIAMNRTDLSRYPSSLVYPGTANEVETMAFNTSNEKGRDYWIAAMEFLADRYSVSAENGLVDKFIIGNEVDYTYDWYLIVPQKDANGRYNRADFNTFMEEYARTVRLANQAIKKYNASAKAAVSITHSWALSRQYSYLYDLDNTNRLYNSYAPKEMLDWMSSIEKARGDYDWCISAHPYPVGTTPSNPTANDLNPINKMRPVTGDWRTSPWITSVNLELYQQYLEQPENMYNGQVREVILTETSICNIDKATSSPEDYERSICEQAASIAQYYYRAANVDCITEIAYFKLHDSENYNLGLIGSDGAAKPAYTVWKYVDTNITFDIANRYLPYITSAGSYRDIMDLTKSGYDWNSKWSEKNIIRRNVEGEEVVRIFGNSRFDTSMKTADAYKKQLGIDKFDSVIVASGLNFADALAGSYLAYVKNAPILITADLFGGVEYYKQINDYIKNNLKSGGTVYVLGGPAAVSEKAVADLSGFNVKRLAGANRFETNILILQEAGVTNEDILVCTGFNYADSLSGSSVKRPILLVGKELNDLQKQYLKSLPGNSYYIIGGVNAVSTEMDAALKKYGEVTRLAGATRYETSVLLAEQFCANAPEAVLAFSLNFPDGLCGGPLAASINAPIILTKTGNEKAAAQFTVTHGIFGGYILGGTGLISEDSSRQIFYTSKVSVFAK